MEPNTALTASLVLVAIAVLLQAGSMLGIWLAVRKLPQQVETLRSDVKQRLDPIVQSATEIVANSREPIAKITANLADISKLLRDRTASADQVAAEALEKTRAQITRVDGMITDVVERLETTAETVQRGVMGPVQELSAVVKGIRSGLEYLFARRRVTNVSEATQDEQLFI